MLVGLSHGDVSVSDGMGTKFIQGREIGGVGCQFQYDPTEGNAITERAPQHCWIQEQWHRAPEVVEKTGFAATAIRCGVLQSAAGKLTYHNSSSCSAHFASCS